MSLKSYEIQGSLKHAILDRLSCFIKYLNYNYHLCVVGQSLGPVQLFATQRTAAQQASLSFTISKSLLKFISIELMMPSNISSYVVPFSSCPQSFPASGSFTMSQFFSSGGQSIGASVLASVFPKNIQG